MGWSIGYDTRWKRDIGYGVPAFCDYPDCRAVIDRGLSFVCGGEPYGGSDGCGLYFCPEHLFMFPKSPQVCDACHHGGPPFKPSPEHPDWIKHKLTDPSWEAWRLEDAGRLLEFLKLTSPEVKTI